MNDRKAVDSAVRNGSSAQDFEVSVVAILRFRYESEMMHNSIFGIIRCDVDSAVTAAIALQDG